jgi:hypothetical protein
MCQQMQEVDFILEQGSWWVYKNIFSNEIDTVILTTESDGDGISSPVPTKIYGDKFFGKCYSGGGVYNLFSNLFGQTKITIAVRIPIEYIDSTKEVYIIREIIIMTIQHSVLIDLLIRVVLLIRIIVSSSKIQLFCLIEFTKIFFIFIIVQVLEPMITSKKLGMLIKLES